MSLNLYKISSIISIYSEWMSLLQMKLLSCMINLFVERSSTNSICFALVVKQLSFVLYCFDVVRDAFVPLFTFTIRGQK